MMSTADAKHYAKRLLDVREQIELLEAEEEQLKRLLHEALGEGGAVEHDGRTITCYTRSVRVYDLPTLAELYPGLYPQMLAKPKPRIDARKFDALVEAGGIDVDKIIEAGGLKLKTSAPTVRVDEAKGTL